MNGVRVQGVDPQCSERVLWQYFCSLCGGHEAVSDVYYPLLNNNAVVIFKDPTAATKMLTCRHEKWTVLPLPNQVFSKQRVWVEQDLTALLQDNEQYQDVLKSMGQVEISFDKAVNQILLTGQSYQIEWAWRYLSDLQDQQQHMSGIFQLMAMRGSSSTLPNGEAMTNGDVSHASFMEKSHAGYSSVPSSRVHKDARVQNGDLNAPSEVTSLAIEGMSSGRRLPSPRMSATGSPGSSPRHQDRGREANKNMTVASAVTSLAIEGLADDGPNSSVIPLVTEDMSNDSPVPSPVSFKVGTSGASSAQQERALVQRRGTSQGSTSGVKVTRQGDGSRAPTAVGDSEQRDHLKSLNMEGNRQFGAEGNRYKSLPVKTFGPLRILPEQADVQPHSSSRNSKGSSNTVPTQADLEKAETLRTAARHHQSLNFHMPAPQDDDYGAGGPQSLQLWNGAQGDDFDSNEMEMRGTYGGQRPFSSLQCYSGSSLRMPSSSKFALLNRSVVELSRKHFEVGHRLKLKIYVEDITRTRTDAVVNAANWELKNIGGVAGALAKAAGPEMERECERIYREHGALRTAQVVKTKAYGRLSQLKYIFHTVGPIFNKEDPEKCVFELAQTFLNCLNFADKLNLESVTFPFISTGIFGMPIDHCVVSLFTALKKYAYERNSNLSTLEQVHFINNDIDAVCNAVLCAETAAKVETMETGLRRMEEGEKRYGQNVFPFCDQKTAQKNGESTSEENRATWDSSSNSDAIQVENAGRRRHRRQQRVDQEGDSPGFKSLLAFNQKSSGSQSRGRSVDRASKTATADETDAHTSGNAQGRDPSPMPKPRSRSNSTSGAERASGSSSKQGKSPDQMSSVTLRGQPQIKQSIIPPSLGAKKRSISLAKTISKGKSSDQSGNDTDQSSTAASETEDTDKTCPICLDDITQPKQLPCGHRFCEKCVERALAVNPRCPKCQRLFGMPTGTQPRDGTMNHSVDYTSHLPGYPGCGMFTITYNFPPGRQEACHPNPGLRYEGTHRVAYLPNSLEGRDVLKMLQKAFDHRLVFTIGESVTTGAKGVITWNDIHHKTSTYGGPTNFGYPDPDYLMRVKEELAAKGITHP